MIRVLLYCEQPILAKGLEVVLKASGQFELCGLCTSAAGVLETIGDLKPDLLLFDVTAEFSLDALADMNRLVPSSKTVLWVDGIEPELAFQAMGIGVRGILRKDLSPEAQLRCLANVNAGELWFEKALTDSLLCSERIVLTKREGQLVALLAQGLKNKEIAYTLSISEGTVKVYLSRLFQKVGAKDRFELALFGLKNISNTCHMSHDQNSVVHPVCSSGLKSLVVHRNGNHHPAPRRTTQQPFPARPAFFVQAAKR